MTPEPNAWLDALSMRPLVLDAAMGTRLVARGLDLTSDDPVLWNLGRSRGDEIVAIHRADVEAGADAIVCNTFGANRANMERLGHAVRLSSAVLSGARHAHFGSARGRRWSRVLILGSIGPIPPSCPGGYREVLDAFHVDGRPAVDAILLETQSAESAERALREFGDAAGLPILVSLHAWPDPPDALAYRLAELGAAALGVNCVVGMPAAIECLARFPRDLGLPLLAKPSACLPGDPPASPESFAEAVPRLLDLGVRLIGGCCGTTEAHIAALRESVDRVASAPW
jgi:methionine synthase I (cobalamin-dependent)